MPWIIYSKAKLFTWKPTDIGLWFPISSMLPTFKIGETFAIFSCSGKMSSLNELWKIINNG